MKKIFSIGFLVLFSIIACGCTQNTETSSASGSLAVLSNSNPDTILSLEQGPILVSFHAAGAQKMEVSLADTSDEYSDYQSFSTTEPFDGSLIFGVPEKNEYKLNISGTGEWTAEVTIPETTPSLTAPLNLSGSGTEATAFFSIEEGKYIFERSETGLSSPLYMLRYSNGSLVMNEDNTYVEPGFGEGSQDSFRFITIPASGDYVLSAIARENPCNWSVSIINAPVIPVMEPGPVILETDAGSTA